MGRSGGAARAAAWGMVAGVVERALLSSSKCARPDLSPVFGARCRRPRWSPCGYSERAADPAELSDRSGTPHLWANRVSRPAEAGNSDSLVALGSHLQTTAAASDGRPAGRDAPPRPAGRPATRPATPKNGPAASRKPAGRPAGRPAKTGWPTGWPAGRPPALTTLWNVRAARNRAQGGYFCPFFLRTAGKMHFSYRPVARRSPHHLASAPGR